MASLLYIAPPDPDEAVLASGALNHVLSGMDDAAVTIITPPEAAPLYRAAPGLAALHAWERAAGFGDWLRLALSHAQHPFDLTLDLSGAPGGYAIHTRRRVVRRTPRALMHRTQEYAGLLHQDEPLAPVLWIDDAARAAAASKAPGAGALLVIAPAARDGHGWANEHFAAVARRLAGGPLTDARIVLLGAPGDAPVTASIAASLDADGLAAFDLAGTLDPLGAAALLEQATFAIGADTLWTHIAAAAGAPTVTLFGPTDERVRAPYGPRTRVLRGGEFEAAVGLPTHQRRSLLEDISVDQVEAAALDVLRAGGLR